MKFQTMLLLYLLMVPPAGGLAQEQEAGRNQTETGEAQEKDTSQAERNDDKDRKASTEVPQFFKPSEEISEDLSVSFPVDI